MRKPSTSSKKRSYKWLYVLLLFAVMAGAVAWYFYYLQQKAIIEAAKTRYKELGIPIPPNFEIHGIDVSNYQNFIYWPAVKNMKVHDLRIGFAFIKATEGLTSKDARFNRNWKKAEEANVVKGAYHFFLATKSGKLQAEHFIKQVKLEKGDLPPVLDIEELYGVPPATMRKRVKEWLDVVEAHYGVRPIVYTYVSFYEKYLGDDFDEYPLWVAHYLEKNKPRIQRDWSFWQHSEKAKVNGITSNVDFNVFKGDSADFKRLLIQ